MSDRGDSSLAYIVFGLKSHLKDSRILILSSNPQIMRQAPLPLHNDQIPTPIQVRILNVGVRDQIPTQIQVRILNVGVRL